MFYFYILRSLKDGHLYYGSTPDLKKRLKQHQKGSVRSTSHRRPLELAYYEAYLDLSLAREREQVIKRSGTARSSLQKRILSRKMDSTTAGQ